MKVLVTGGCGFLGSNLAAFYLGRQAEVVIIDALFRTGGEQNLEWLRGHAGASNLHFYKLDLAETEAVELIFQRHAPFDFVCHVGGQVAMTTSLQDPRRDLQTNVVGTFNILEAVRKHCAGALLAYSSTNKVYGDLEYLRYEESATRYLVPDFPQGFDESLPLDFSTPYGCSKGSADQYVRDWHRVYGVKTVVFRHSSVYGGRQFPTFDQGWVGWFCQKAIEQKMADGDRLKTRNFTISGTGKQVRDVLHARDLVRIYNAAFERREKIAGNIFNVGGGPENSLSLLELFAILSENLDLPQGLVHSITPRRKSDQNVFIADIRKADRVLSWRPELTAKAGITEMLEWARETLAFQRRR